jgi:predicted XRE-type DNA-binding protein
MDKDFEKYLAKIEDPNYSGGSRNLPKNANALQRSKYNICQSILAYQQDNDLSDEEIAHRIKLSIPEVEEMLFCRIEKFSLDRLLTYASKILAPDELVIERRKRDSVHA